MNPATPVTNQVFGCAERLDRSCSYVEPEEDVAGGMGMVGCLALLTSVYASGPGCGENSPDQTAQPAVDKYSIEETGRHVPFLYRHWDTNS
jgi:hypothetical protein